MPARKRFGHWALAHREDYAPLLLWGPLLGAVTVHYCRHRTAASPGTAPLTANRSHT
ncbi:hypothetical protein ABZ383_23470 [Streptomyces sp. NPDC005900]|uniref:hypothetical protein n=1 Tax=Streptomyces sp. NPDC005900 TaxID=3154569 RepID=UPI0033EA0710